MELSQIRKAEHGSAEWLAQRWSDPEGRKRVAASQVAAIYGLHPWLTPEEYAAELLAPAPPQPKEQNRAMMRGTRLEDALLAWANADMGRFFETPDVLFVCNEGNARMIATLDGYDGSEVLEIKTTTKAWTGDLPDHWRIQGIQQAICANVDFVNWAIFDRTQDLHYYSQHVSSDERVSHIDAVVEWLSAINNGVPPEGVSWTRSTVETLYPEVVRESVELGPRALSIISELNSVKYNEKVLNATRAKLEGELCDLLQDAGTGTVNGDAVVTWRTQSRKSLDQKSLKRDHPDLIEQYQKESTYRVLRVKGDN